MGGETDPYTSPGHFTSFNFSKCHTEGSPAPAPAPPASPYVPGEAGAAWSVEEMLIVRAKLYRMFNEGSHVMWELPLHHQPDMWTSAPNAAKMLRLGFHDCLKHADGGGGCDGCLEWTGVGHRYNRSDLTQGLFNMTDRMDGHNNGLNITAQVLEGIYTERTFPSRVPILPRSLQESGKSRADLWAFATLVAVEFSMELNNNVCLDENFAKKFGMSAAFVQCHPRAGMSDCLAYAPRPFNFWTGRRDCISTGFPWKNSSSPSFMTAKKELHPDPHTNGAGTLAFFKRDFAFNGRETVAIMGGHTLGRLHVIHNLLRYVWKARSGALFNNGYYRNIAKKDDWQYDTLLMHEPTCARGTVGNAEGERPKARWVTHTRGDTRTGGPVQWIQEKLVCPLCSHLQHGFRNSQHQFKYFTECCLGRTGDSASNITESEELNFIPCQPKCERWKFIVGFDETALNAEMGLLKSFQVDANGIPFGCSGWEKFNLEHWGGWTPGKREFNNRHFSWSLSPEGGKGEPQCDFNRHADPLDDMPVYQIVLQYADDQSKWLADFFPTLEKMLANGYPRGELRLSPVAGMTNFSCAFPDHQDPERFYSCVAH